MTPKAKRAGRAGSSHIRAQERDHQPHAAPQESPSFRATAVRVCEPRASKSRLNERFSVPGALVICARRTRIGTWKKIGPPCEILDIGAGGLSFLNVSEKMLTGTKLRLTILLPGRMPVRLTGKEVWIEADGQEESDLACNRPHVCGIQFTDYDAKAWSTLCALHAEHAGPMSLAAKI